MIIASCGCTCSDDDDLVELALKDRQYAADGNLVNVVNYATFCRMCAEWCEDEGLVLHGEEEIDAYLR